MKKVVVFGNEAELVSIYWQPHIGATMAAVIQDGKIVSYLLSDVEVAKPDPASYSACKARGALTDERIMEHARTAYWMMNAGDESDIRHIAEAIGLAVNEDRGIRS